MLHDTTLSVHSCNMPVPCWAPSSIHCLCPCPCHLHPFCASAHALIVPCRPSPHPCMSPTCFISSTSHPTSVPIVSYYSVIYPRRSQQFLNKRGLHPNSCPCPAWNTRWTEPCKNLPSWMEDILWQDHPNSCATSNQSITIASLSTSQILAQVHHLSASPGNAIPPEQSKLPTVRISL